MKVLYVVSQSNFSTLGASGFSTHMREFLASLEKEHEVERLVAGDVKALDPDTSNDTPWWLEVDADWWEDDDNGVVALTGGNVLQDVSQQPKYVIEKLPPSPVGLGAGESLDAADTYLQITARGVGGAPTTVVVLQSIYKW